MIIETQCTIIYQRNKDGQDMWDSQGNCFVVFEHCSMNRNGERLHNYLNKNREIIMERMCGTSSGVF